MSKLQLFQALLTKSLAVFANEIFGAVEKTIAEYEEEVDRTKEENHNLLQENARLQRLLMEQEDPEPLQVKEEQEELLPTPELIKTELIKTERDVETYIAPEPSNDPSAVNDLWPAPVEMETVTDKPKQRTMVESVRMPCCHLCSKNYTVGSLPGHLRLVHGMQNVIERKLILNLCNKRTNIRKCPCPILECGVRGQFLDRHMERVHKELSDDQLEFWKDVARRRQTDRLLQKLRDTNPEIPLLTTTLDDVVYQESGDSSSPMEESDEESQSKEESQLKEESQSKEPKWTRSSPILMRRAFPQSAVLRANANITSPYHRALSKAKERKQREQTLSMAVKNKRKRPRARSRLNFGFGASPCGNGDCDRQTQTENHG